MRKRGQALSMNRLSPGASLMKIMIAKIVLIVIREKIMSVIEQIMSTTDTEIPLIFKKKYYIIYM